MKLPAALHFLEHEIAVVLRVLLGLAVAYYFFAYWLLPALWHRHYEHQPQLETAPKITLTKEGIPGDPLNIGLVGSESDVVHSMVTAGWLPADSITWHTSERITTSALFGKPYPTAPVSNLYVFNRKEDLAFEQAVSGNSRQRHHVRFWRADALGKNGQPFWIGAATFDRSVGVSHLTGAITHHIAPDLDEERDKIITDLLASKQLVSQYQVTGLGPTLLGRNGGGDQYYTDGELSIGVLTLSGAVNSAPISLPANPLPIQAKNHAWSAFRWLLKQL